MAEAIADRVQRYILDGSDDDLRRLMSVSEVFADNARRSLVRAGVSSGWNVLDCGCGPMGALAVMADLVGPAHPPLIEQNGGPPNVVEKLPGIARTAGLEVEGIDGFFRTWEPELGLSLHAASMAAARERATSASVTEQISDIVARIRGVNPAEYSWVTSPFFLDLTLRKPA